MKVLGILCVAAVVIWLTSTALADKYDGLAAKGYRWVTADGQFGFRSRDDLLQMLEQFSSTEKN
jgi:hypothetical protein